MCRFLRGNELCGNYILFNSLVKTYNYEIRPVERCKGVLEIQGHYANISFEIEYDFELERLCMHVYIFQLLQKRTPPFMFFSASREII